jgi:hypothetical protein
LHNALIRLGYDLLDWNIVLLAKARSDALIDKIGVNIGRQSSLTKNEARMTIKKASAPYLVSPIMAAVMLMAGGLVPGHAQQADRPNANKPSNPAAVKQRSVASQKSAASQSQQKPWSLEDALPDRQPKAARARTSDVQGASTSPLGRIPLEQGSLGFETESKFKPNEFSDGRRVPGQETVKRQEPSYFGLSLSVPTDNKSFFPVPLLPPLGRAE